MTYQTEKDFSQQANDYFQVEALIGELSTRYKRYPTPDQIAKNVQLNNDCFSSFKRWVGIEPIQFFRLLTVEHVRKILAETRIHGSTDRPNRNRSHDLFIHFEVKTPKEFNLMKMDIKMEYGFHSTPFGECLLVRKDKEILHLAFLESHDHQAALNRLEKYWPQAVFSESRMENSLLINQIFSADPIPKYSPIHVLLKGTNFQATVWKALLTIPMGSLASYEDIAVSIGRPRAVRAVANAIGANPIAYLIPCHRVIAKSGKIHRYRWGTARKKAMIGWEAVKYRPF